MFDPASSAVESWKQGTGYKKKVLGNYQNAAVAAAKSNDDSWYFVVLFAGMVESMDKQEIIKRKRGQGASALVKIIN